ncbi:PHP domain-containing protein [Alteromonas oceanisediminis]|uniref:PHP domain-containing protein n=1 Tax=Alteromonas oceanisediminis TaxID=2836180 RepID=UPI002023B77E|nr:PHP domain-containing protein [Alteromonas oceanisediminis]
MSLVSTVNSSSPLKIDLHSHTRHSDGHLTPEEIVQRAHTMQVDVLAITDHDTVAGIAPALRYQQRQKRPLNLIAGIELSTRWHAFDIHIIGLNIDPTDSAFQSRLACQHETRRARAANIARKLGLCGFDEAAEQAIDSAQGGQVTRSHFAKALVSAGIVKDNVQAFKQYLGKGKRAYVAAQWISIQEAITWIKEAGGQAVLAHPSHYDMATKWLRRLVSEFALAGGHGIELSYPNLTKEKQALLIEMARSAELMGSSGSDFHFPSRWTELGRRSTLPDDITPIWHDWNL